MKTLILAAGRSRRAKPIEDKNFLSYLGKPLIEHQLEALQRAGFENLVLAAGEHNLEALREVAERYGATVVQQDNPEDGMAGAVLAMEPHMNGEPLFVISSNDVVGEEAYKQLRAALERDSDAALLAYKVDDYFPGGYLKLHEDERRIHSLVEKPGEGNEPSDLVNIVLHLHKDSGALFDALKAAQTENDDHYEVAMDSLMKTLNYEALPYAGDWQAVKHPWHALDLMDQFLAQLTPRIHPSAQIADSAVIRGDVVIEEEVRIFDHAVIQGPAYIGQGSIVANGALVRSSMVGANCIVGFGTEIARSLVGNDCWFHTNYIGDSLIGDHCSFGSGAVTANLRLDEAEIAESGRNKLGAILGERIRIGVNTCVMPGVRIGSDCMIGSGINIEKDIPEGQFVYAKTELVMKANRATIDPEAREEMRRKLS